MKPTKFTRDQELEMVEQNRELFTSFYVVEDQDGEYDWEIPDRIAKEFPEEGPPQCLFFMQTHE